MTRSAEQALRKFRTERRVERYIANPLVSALARLGISTRLATELQTVGRMTGKTRHVPVAACFDDSGAWVISQHGSRSGRGANITANPQVRIHQGKQWRSGLARFQPDDDVTARARTFASRPAFAGLAVATLRALMSTPVSVRSTFTDGAA
ncbi:nitroreductase family deazaflavin-dependent oxidoreductase [Mycobacterium sp. SMC-11]|uniref:nitroreductase family deazaflavin-dependent oxidoreductase n=1 Tax=Mycobacterium sp. SMC-11 TaxID=3385969 RepID=UPI00390CA7A7